MTTITLSTSSRTAMARKLSQSLAELGHRVPHAQATRVIASVLDSNEHALAAALKASAATSPAVGRHKCSVEGCSAAADFEVRLFDIYLHSPPKVFDDLDFTCPYLCAEHMAQNESEAQGERRPRGTVSYPFTNRQRAQGFTIYRPLASHGT